MKIREPHVGSVYGWGHLFSAKNRTSGNMLREDSEMSDPTEELRQNIMLSCRILAMEGMVDRITGHVSARIAGTDQMWIRCRSPEEEGLR